MKVRNVEFVSEGSSQKKQDVLGEEFGRAVYWLDNAITNAHIELKIFRGLFVHSPERVQVLNEASGLVAMYISKALWDSICMALCRLTDPAQTGKNANLSLGTIHGFLDEEYKEEYSKKGDAAIASVEVFRARRNKVLAHADVGIAQKLNVLDGSSFNDAKTTLDLIAECLNFIHSKFFDSTTAYELTNIGASDEGALLKSLFLGNRMLVENHAAQDKAVEEKNYSELDRLRDEIAVPDWIYSK